MASAGFVPEILAIERLQTYALDRTANSMCNISITVLFWCSFNYVKRLVPELVF